MTKAKAKRIKGAWVTIEQVENLSPCDGDFSAFCRHVSDYERTDPIPIAKILEHKRGKEWLNWLLYHADNRTPGLKEATARVAAYRKNKAARIKELEQELYRLNYESEDDEAKQALA